MTEGRTNSLKCFLKENIFKFLVFSCMSSVYNSEERCVVIFVNIGFYLLYSGSTCIQKKRLIN